MHESLISSENVELRRNVPKGVPLILALAGPTDAGAVLSQLDEYLWQNSNLEEIFRFDSDSLLDYRARRPLITFDEDHFTDYEPEELTISLGHDALGAPFLLLSGYEPDFRWEQFVSTVLEIIAEFDVSVTTWAHAIPMPVPHTRPIRATVSGTREDLIQSRSIWKPTTKLPASLSHVLEYRLQTLGDDVVGFALLVPHYLANNEYPEALLAALDCIMSATGLIFNTDEVRADAQKFVTQVETQIHENEESLQMLRGLESRYDDYMQDQTTQTPLVAEGGTIPTADQLASELERFLAQQRDDNSSSDNS